MDSVQQFGPSNYEMFSRVLRGSVGAGRRGMAGASGMGGGPASKTWKKVWLLPLSKILNRTGQVFIYVGLPTIVIGTFILADKVSPSSHLSFQSSILPSLFLSFLETLEIVEEVKEVEEEVQEKGKEVEEKVGEEEEKVEDEVEEKVEEEDNSVPAVKGYFRGQEEKFGKRIVQNSFVRNNSP